MSILTLQAVLAWAHVVTGEQRKALRDDEGAGVIEWILLGVVAAVAVGAIGFWLIGFIGQKQAEVESTTLTP